MNETLVKSGEGQALVPSPVPPEERLEAHEHSPTLMAGEVAGSQGLVQVWGPDKRRLKIAAWSMGAVGALYFWLWFGMHLDLSGLMYFVSCYLIGLGFVIATLRRPCYVTTDDA